MVLGFALETQYELTVDLVETQRELRPAATLALGQASQPPLLVHSIMAHTSARERAAQVEGAPVCVQATLCRSELL